MDREKIRVLVVDSDRAVLDRLGTVLSAQGYTVEAATSTEEGLELWGERSFGICVINLDRLPSNRLERLGRIRQDHPDTRMIVLTSHAALGKAVDAIREGAVDCIVKPFDDRRLVFTLSNLLQTRQPGVLWAEPQESMYRGISPQEMVGVHETLQRVREQITDVAQRDVDVLIQGETGTGKEVVARWVHCRSRRRSAPFVAVDCGSLPEGIVESELFGHEKGAFTDARQRRRGRFEAAQGGTLLLDDVENLGLGVQRKLLRVLQDRQFERVGGEETIRVDLRVICTSNMDLQEGVQRGRFREDLYYRIAVVPIVLPPLRDRGEDVVLLAEHHSWRRWWRRLRGAALQRS